MAEPAFDCPFHVDGIPDGPCICSDGAARTGQHEIVTVRYELADFDPETGHLHTCSPMVREQIGCGCAGHLYAIAQDAERRLAASDATCGSSRGCCTSCDGTGGTYTGPCWDCRGTGHPHKVTA